MRKDFFLLVSILMFSLSAFAADEPAKLRRAFTGPQMQSFGYTGGFDVEVAMTKTFVDPFSFSCDQENRRSYLECIKDDAAPFGDSTKYLVQSYLPILEQKIRTTAMQYALLKDTALAHTIEESKVFAVPDCEKSDEEFKHFWNLLSEASTQPGGAGATIDNRFRSITAKWASVEKEVRWQMLIAIEYGKRRAARAVEKYCEGANPKQEFGNGRSELKCLEMRNTLKLLERSPVGRNVPAEYKKKLVEEFEALVGLQVGGSGEKWLRENYVEKIESSKLDIVLKEMANHPRNSKIAEKLTRLSETNGALLKAIRREVEALKKLACDPNPLFAAVKNYPEIVLQALNDIPEDKRAAAQLLFCRFGLKKFFEDRSKCGYVKEVRKLGRDLLVTNSIIETPYRIAKEKDGSLTAKLTVYVMDKSGKSEEELRRFLSQWSSDATAYYNRQSKSCSNRKLNFRIYFVKGQPSKYLTPQITLNPCRGDCSKLRANTGSFYTSSTLDTVVHEVGHFFGLEDEYSDLGDDVSDIQSPRDSNSIMRIHGSVVDGVKRWTRLLPRHCEQIFAPVMGCE